MGLDAKEMHLRPLLCHEAELPAHGEGGIVMVCVAVGKLTTVS